MRQAVRLRDRPERSASTPRRDSPRHLAGRPPAAPRLWHNHQCVDHRIGNEVDWALQIDLLGRFALRAPDQDIQIEAPRVKALLADLLIHTGTARPRPHLAFRLWPDSTEKQARTNLRQLLHNLRRALPESDRFLQVTARAITWKPSAPCILDLTQLENAIRAADNASADGRFDEEARHLIVAADLYRGPLLPECYEPWLQAPRADIEQRALSALDRLITLLEDKGEPRLAARYAERLRRLDPMNEAVYRRLIVLYGQLGESAKAQAVYLSCQTMLADEIGATPSEATNDALESLSKTRRPPLGPSECALESAEAWSGPRPADLVGREAEWTLLRSAWGSASSGTARMVVVSGEAGIGKSHLCEVFAGFVRASGVAVASARCYAAEGRLAYAPVIDWLRSDIFHRALEQLDDPWLLEVGRLLPDCLPLRSDGSTRLEPGAENGQQRLFEGLARAFLSAPAPLVLLLDDLQWSDAETLTWLRFLLRRGRSARLLVLATVRIEETDRLHPLEELRRALARDDQLDEIDLGPLNAQETVALASRETGRDLQPAEADQLYRETEGHPLFIVESIRSGRLSTNRPTQTKSPVPAKVQAVLDARLAQLSTDARGLAELAATAGRSFDRDLLSLASAWREDAVYGALDELWQRRIVRPNGPARYDFTHDRLREAAYRSAGPIRQTLLHRQIARAIENLNRDDVDSVASALAVHYDRAGDVKIAIQYYERAGEIAQRVYAHQDASQLFERALELIKEASAPGRLRETELRMLEALGSSLVSLRNYSDLRVQQVYRRAETLCTAIGRSTSAPVLRGLAISAVMQGDQTTVERCGRQLLALATAGTEISDAQNDPVLLVEAHYVLGVNAFWQGRYTSSKRHLQSAVSAYRPSQHHVHISRYAQDPGLVCSIRLALTELYLGLPDAALERCRATLAEAEAQNHPMSWVYVEAFATWIYIEARQWAEALTTVNRMQRRIERHNLTVYWPTVAWLYRMRAEMALDTKRWSVEDVAAGLDRYTLPGAGRAQMELICASACEMIGAPETGLHWLNARLIPAAEDEEPYVRAEMLRVRARLRALLSEPLEQIDEDLGRAIETARQQNALLFELRATADRFRLTADHNRASARHSALVETYARFTEGYETPDLVSVRNLIEGYRA